MAGSSGSAYIDIVPSMDRYFRQARAEIRANPIVGRVDVELDRASLERAERRLQQTSDRAVAARNRQASATESLRRAERELAEVQALGTASANRQQNAIDRVARAQRDAAMAARQRQRAEQDLASGRAEVVNLRARLDTTEARAEADRLERSLSGRVIRQLVRLEAVVAPYLTAVRAATRDIRQRVTLVMDNRVTRTLASAVMMGMKLTAVLGAATLAAGALVGPLGGVVAILGQAAGAAALLPALLGAAAAVLGTIKIGFGGIGAAFKELSKPPAGGGGDGGAAKAAAQQAKAVASAERSLAQAQKSSQRAQADLNRERAAAVRRLRDMRLEVAQSGRDERAAAIEVQRAKDALAALGRDGEPVSLLDRDQAQLDVENAEANFERIKIARADLVADNDKAQRAGIEGDAQVVAARESVADANEQVADAQRAITEAMASTADAATAAGAATDSAFDKLSANGKSLVTALRALSPAWTDLKNSVQDAMTGGLDVAITDLADKRLPLLKAGMTGIATAINGGIRGSIRALMTESAGLNLAKFFDNTTAATGNLTKAFEPVTAGLVSMMGVGSEFLPMMTEGAVGAATAFRDWAADGDNVRNMIQTALGVLSQLGQIIGNVGGIISGVFRASETSGGGLLNMLVMVTGKVSEFVNSVQGQDALGGFFGSVAAVVSTLIPILAQVASIVGTTVAPAIADFVQAAGPGLSSLVDGIAVALAAIAPSLAGLGDAAGQVFATLGEALVTVAPVLPQIVDLFATLLVAVLPLVPVLADLAATVLPPIVSLLETLAPVLPIIVGAFLAWQAAMIILSTVMAIYNGVMAAAAVVQWALNTAMLANPMTWVVIAIVALVAAIVLIATKTTWFQTIWEYVWNAIKAVVGFAWDMIKKYIDFIVGYWTTLWHAAVAAKDWVVGAFQAVVDFFTSLPEKIKNAASGMWDGIKDAFKDMLNTIIGWWNNLELGWDKIEVKFGPDIPAFHLSMPDIPTLKSGGKLPGGSRKGKDDIPLLGAKGEFMIQSSAVDKYGVALFEALNAGKFAAGGSVSGASSGGGTLMPEFGEMVDLLRQVVTNTTPEKAAVTSLAPVVSSPVLDALDPAVAADPALAATTINTALDTVQSGAAAMAGTFGTSMTGAGELFTGLAGTMLGQKLAVMDPTMAGINAGLVGTTGAFTTATGIINPTWQDMANRVMGAKVGTVDPALAGMRGGALETANTYGYASSLLAQKWDTVREGTAAPVRWSINTVFNDGVVGSWNAVSDLLGTQKINPYPVRFAKGGEVPGYGHLDTVPALLMPGEFVLRRNVVNEVGRETLIKLNQGADPQRFAAGGPVDIAAPPWGGGGGESNLKPAAILARRNIKKYWPQIGTIGGYRAQDAYPDHPSGLALDIMTGDPMGTEINEWLHREMRALALNYTIWKQMYRPAGRAGSLMEDRGSATQNHMDHVHALFNANGVPGIQDGGVGGGGGPSIQEIITGMTAPIWDRVAGAVGKTNFGGLTKAIPAGYMKSFREATDKKIMELAASVMSADPGGADVERWRPMSIRAMKWVGRGLRADDVIQQNAMLSQIKSESGGDPNRAQEIVDINGTGEAAGVGLLQIIPSTWAANRDPALPDNRRDPFANMVGALRYYTGRYGSDLTTMWGQGHGYAEGGIMGYGKGTYNKTAIEPERVLDPQQTRTYDSILPLLEAVNRNIAIAAPAMTASDHNKLIEAPTGTGTVIGQQVEAQYLVDPYQAEKATRRAVKRATAASGMVL